MNKFLNSQSIVILLFIFLPLKLLSQNELASPSNWLYPEGNSAATRHNIIKSYPQKIEDFQIKWVSDTLAGDLKPLIGNIIYNSKLLPEFDYAPNEITSVIGGKLLVVDAIGKTHIPTKMPPFVKDATVLFDTLTSVVSSNVRNSVCIGVETVEAENLRDSLAYAYICSFDEKSDSVAILKRLAVNLRDYKPNIFGSVRPFFGKRIAGINQIYAVMNMSQPISNNPQPAIPTFFRGLAQFNSRELKSFYPLNDVGDDFDSRQWLAYESNFAQPSIMLVNGSQKALLPSYPTPNLDVIITNPVTFTQTDAKKPYLFAINMDNISAEEDFPPFDLSALLLTNDSRPRIRPYFVNIKDAATNDSIYILVAEEYRGTEGSNGRAKLHLFDKSGNPLTLPLELIGGTGKTPSFQGANDHQWSIATGNVDGKAENTLLPYYPNNPGNEIIVTQSTREFVVPNNKLMVFRYYTGTPIPKKSPPNSELNPFDTICTMRINGWLAAVNDIDGADNNKDEILLVDGSRLLVLQMFDYSSYEFRDNRYFDTIATFQFDMETIQNVAVVDLEGDGKNDILVTTNDRTYLIGTKIYDNISIIYPKNQASPPERFCVGDELNLRWKTTFFSDKEVRPDSTLFVNIYFRPYINGQPTDTLITIITNFKNESDTTLFPYYIDSLVYGYEGRFIIESATYPSFTRDSSAIISFVYPDISIDQLPRETYYADEVLVVTGLASCMDTVSLQYSFDGVQWTSIGESEVFDDYSYLVRGDLPCSMFYDCLLPDQDSIIKIAVVGKKGDFTDTSQIIDIWLLPEKFPYFVQPCTSSCPTRKIVWDISEMENPCDSVIISIANVNSSTFSFIAKVSVTDEKYEWNIPSNLPEWVKLRVCCENSCVRKDTVFHDIKATYIGIVAPNPFNPITEEASINYRVPKDTYVTIKIIDQANRLVKELISSELRYSDIVYCDKWDGTIWDGSYAANGLYYISLELSNGEREIYPIYVKK